MLRFPFLVAALVLAACTKDVAAPADLPVAVAAARFAANEATPVDANTPEYRAMAGWVPGAVLLSDFAEFSFAELPADKSRPLVFYCTSRG